MTIIVAGTSRSGKSTIIKEVCRTYPQFNYVPMDSIISTLEERYPGTGIRHLDDNREFSPVLAAFVRSFCMHLDYEAADFILDLYQLYPEDYHREVAPLGIPALYVGYPSMSQEEKLKDIRAYQRKEDWTVNTPDGEMLKILGDFIREGRVMSGQCSTLGIPFFDSGSSFPTAVRTAVRHISSIIENS